MKCKSYIIGIDEVGRGALAGPVTVAAAAIPVNFKISGLKDSKKLTPKQRGRCFEYVKSRSEIYYAVSSVYPKVIDRINITQAANLAATRALKRLVANKKWIVTRILLDGGLYLTGATNYKSYSISTVVRGDEKYNCIKLASIIAKVTRDRFMTKNSKKFPFYSLEEHKGYGTKKHMKAIYKHGSLKIHRKTFKILRGEVS